MIAFLEAKRKKAEEEGIPEEGTMEQIKALEKEQEMEDQALQQQQAAGCNSTGNTNSIPTTTTGSVTTGTNSGSSSPTCNIAATRRTTTATGAATTTNTSENNMSHRQINEVPPTHSPKGGTHAARKMWKFEEHADSARAAFYSETGEDNAEAENNENMIKNENI